MNKIFKTILITSVITLGLGFLALPSVRAVEVDELIVEYWSETENRWIQWLPSPQSFPIFYEANFLPGDSVTRLVRVTNNNPQTQRIATEAINYPDPIPEYDLSRALMIIIKEGATDLYGGSGPTGPKSLYDFYRDSENYQEISLSDLAGYGGKTQYDFTISFPSEKQNEWQGATTTFNILIGFQQGTSPLPPSPPAPPPGGGTLPPGLTILDESIEILSCCETKATIIWSTSYLSTSRVIYSTEGQSHTLNLSVPNYGYANSKEGDDTALEKVTNHSLTITGLSPETTYYYRCVSHASPATISREYKFSTPKIGTCFAIEAQIETEGGVAGGVLPEGVPGPEEVGKEIEETQVIAEIEEQGLNLNSLLAAIGSFFTSAGFSWLILLIIVILTILFLLSLTKKRPEKKKQWIWPLGILALIIFYCYFYYTNCWLLILILAILVILFLFYREKLKKEEQL